MKFSREQIEFMKNASDHVNVLCGGRGYGKTHQLIKEMEDKINKLEKENQQLKKQKDDVVEYIKYQLSNLDFNKEEDMKAKMLGSMILVVLEDNRMLGEIDDK